MDKPTIEALIQAARQGGHVVIEREGFAPVVLAAQGMNLMSLTGYRDQPARVKQEVSLQSPEDFAAYVLRFAEMNSIVLADEQKGQYVAILDYHLPPPFLEKGTGARWGEHVAAYTCPFSPEWTTWTAASGKPMNQEAFALFMEDNFLNITRPDHSTMIEVSRRLEVTKGCAFKSSKRLSDGQVQFQYTENQEAAAGEFQVPEEFVLALPVFRGGQAYEVKARLRYRLQGSQLSMWYELIRPDRIRDHAVAEITTKVRGLLTDKVPLYLGETE